MPVEVGLGVRNAELKTGLEEAESAIAEFKSRAETNLGNAAIGSIGAYASIEGIQSVVEYGSHLNDLHEQFGVSLQDLQRFGYAATQNGVELDQSAMAFNRLAVSRSRALQGNGADVEAFARLGVSIQQLRELSPEDLMMQIGRGSMDAAEMVTVLGRNAEELVPTLRKLADGSQAFGQTMSDDVVQGLEKAETALNDFKNTATVATGTAIADVVTPMIEAYQKAAFALGYRLEELHGGSATSSLGSNDPAYIQAMKDYDAQKSGADKRPGAAGGGSGPDDDGGGDEKLTLAQRLAAIDQESATKRLSIEDQITAARHQQADLEAQLGESNDPNQRGAIEKDVLETEKQIDQLKADGDRAHEESVKRANEERLRAEEQYMRLKEENDKRAATLAIQTETDPAKKKQLIDEQVAATEKQIEDMKHALDVWDQSRAKFNKPETTDEEELRKRLLDAEERLHDLQRDDKPEKAPQQTAAPYDELSQIGARLSNVDYHSAGGGKNSERNAKNIEDAAYYARKIYEKGQTSDSATFAGGGS